MFIVSWEICSSNFKSKKFQGEPSSGKKKKSKKEKKKKRKVLLSYFNTVCVSIFFMSHFHVWGQFSNVGTVSQECQASISSCQKHVGIGHVRSGTPNWLGCQPSTSLFWVSEQHFTNQTSLSIVWLGWAVGPSFLGASWRRRKSLSSWLGSLWVPGSSWNVSGGGPLSQGQCVTGWHLAPLSTETALPKCSVSRGSSISGLWGAGGWGGWTPPWAEGLTLCHLWLVASARQALGKEHEIEVINYQLSSFLIQIVKGLPLHLPCREKGFTTSIHRI